MITTGAMANKKKAVYDDIEEELIELRTSSVKRFKNIFDDIILKYSAVPETGRDEVDIMNLTIVKDYGQTRRMKPLPCGYFANKYRRPAAERKKLNRLINKLKKKSGHNNSPCKRIQSGVLKRKQGKIADLKFSPMNMKIPILENSPQNTKLCRDSLTSLEDAMIKNNDLQNNKLQIISDLFIYKSKEAHYSEVSVLVNITPSKKNQSEDNLILNEYMTPKNTESDNKNQSIEHLFKYFRASSTPRPQRKPQSFVQKKSLPTPKRNTKRGDLISDIPCVKKFKLDLVEDSSKSKTPTSSKGKALHLNRKSPSRSENNIKGAHLASPDFSIIGKSKLNSAKDSLEGKVVTRNKSKILNWNKKISTGGISNDGNENIFLLNSTPKCQQKLQSFIMKESSLTPKNSTKLDDLVSLDFSPIENSKLVLQGNSSEDKISTLSECRDSDLTKKKSTDNILNNKAEKISPLKMSKEIVYGLKYLSSVTTVNRKISPSYVMKSSSRVIMEGVKEDDIVNFSNIPTRLFQKDN